MVSKVFRTLYGKPSSSSKIKKWDIQVYKKDNSHHYIIERSHGYIGCKETKSIREIENGKNIGKKNETTIEMQAMKEAEALWKKQKENGYVENVEDVDNVTFLPMLAHDFNKRGKDINVPFYIQPKIDGVRLCVKADGTLFSRTGKEYNGMYHIKESIKMLGLRDSIILDGELFTFDLDFENICSVCRKSNEIDPRQIMMKFYIFDMYDTLNENLSFEQRYKFLQNLNLRDPLVLVLTEKVSNKEDIDVKHEYYLKECYEGIMLRNVNGIYKSNYRSIDLQKYKTFQDQEYKIIGCTEATGNDKGTIIFTCIDPKTNLKFSVRPKGSREQRKYWFDNFELIKHKMLTVRYQNLTEYGVPRFPVGISIRDYE